MGNPSDLFDDFENPDQLRAWRDLVAELAARCVRRYGRDEVRAWLFETWNEPDLPFWRWGERGLLNHFDACRAGLDAVDPALRLGGPATARTLSPLFKAFLAHCDGGASALTGEPAGRLDFVSVHEKGAPAHDEDLTPRPLAMIERELMAVAYIRENHPRLAGLPFTTTRPTRSSAGRRRIPGARCPTTPPSSPRSRTSTGVTSPTRTGSRPPSPTTTAFSAAGASARCSPISGRAPSRTPRPITAPTWRRRAPPPRPSPSSSSRSRR